MSQLHRFLESLNAAELEQVKKMRLIGKEQALFKYTLSQLHKEIPAPETICAALQISPSHLYKINSILLNKFYSALVPSGGQMLLDYLKQKGHFVLLRSEASTQEKNLLKIKSTKKTLEKFYLGLFHLYIDFPFKFYDARSVNELGKKYLASLEKQTLSDELYVKHHKLFAELNRCAASKNPIRSLGIDFKKELAKEEELKKGAHFLALYYLQRSAASWYTYYEKDNEKKLAALKKAMELKDKIAQFFDIDIGNFLQLLYADALFMGGDAEAGFKEFEKAFNAGVKENMYGYYYFCEQFVLLKIIRKDFESAEKLLDEIFAPCIKQGLDIYATRGALAYAKLFLACGNLKEAIQYINSGFTINEKSFYLPFDIQLRLLETIYFILKKDWDFSSRLCKRNLKFVQTQDENPAAGRAGKLLEDYFVLWEALSVFIRAKKKNKEIPTGTENAIRNFSSQHQNLYCGVVGKILN